MLASAGQIAAALDAAHRKGVIHRDLKPSNVMLTASGVKLLDFGLARLRDEAADAIEASTKSLLLTEQGTVLGTVPYMAPEQIEAREADARTDIFALGAILYEMASGRPPFEGRSPASVMAAILTHDPQPLSSVRPGVPAGIDRVVKKCMAKDPDERWQSAADLMAALQWIRDDTLSPHGAPPGTEKRPYLKQGVLATTAIAATLAVAALWILQSRRAPESTPATAPQFIPVTFRTGTVSAARFAPDGATVIYSAAWGGDRLRAVHDAPRQPGIAAAEHRRRQAARRVVDWGSRVSPRRSRRREVAPAFAHAALSTRVAMTGGAPRELLDDVVAADWSAGSAIWPSSGGIAVEFPLGTDGSRSASNSRTCGSRRTGRDSRSPTGRTSWCSTVRETKPRCPRDGER